MKQIKKDKSEEERISSVGITSFTFFALESKSFSLFTLKKKD